MADKTFGQLMAGRRAELGWSLRELADKAKPCSPSHVSQIEQNKYPDKDGTPQRPSMDLLDRLAAALNIPLEEARLSANYPLPISEQDAVAVEIAANLKNVPQEARLLFLSQARAVRKFYVDGQHSQENNGQTPEEGKTQDTPPPPDRGVKPGDPDYREPSGTLTPPPRRKRRDEVEPPKEKQGRRSA